MPQSVSKLLDTEYKEYSRYVVFSRAIPDIRDGLKPVHRRVIYTASKGSNSFTKVIKLAGASLAIHPHGDSSCSGAICTLTQRFAGANNYSLFDGDGAFGCRIQGPGNGNGSPRYVSVKLSKITEEVLFKDKELITMRPSYDEETMEPDYYLPLVPMVLMNPTTGIAVGYACDIPPLNMQEIIDNQIQYLQGKPLKELLPFYNGFNGRVFRADDKIQTEGCWKIDGKTRLYITELPIGITREQYAEHLDALVEKNIVYSYEDNCAESFDFKIILKKDNDVYDNAEKLIKTFKLRKNVNPNLTVIGIDGQIKAKSVDDIITEFTSWREEFFKLRYQRILKRVLKDLSFKEDLIRVIQKGIMDNVRKKQKAAIIQEMKDISVKPDHLDRIIGLPIFHFSLTEVDKLKDEVEKLQKKRTLLEKLIKSPKKLREIFIKELTESKKLF